MTDHAVVDHAEWVAQRRRLLDREKAFTHERDRLAEERRALPWEPVDRAYTFTGADGEVTLSGLFGGHHQLLVYHFMFPPDWEAGCPHCSFWADNFDGVDVHLAQRDIAFAAVSRAPFDRIAGYRARMGWSFPWFSSDDGPFNYDFGASFPPADQDRPVFNYGTQTPGMSDREGVSAFYRDDDGRIFHTYSTYGRGIDLLNGAYNFIDLSPLGRHEVPGDTQSWVRRHDEYAPH